MEQAPVGSLRPSTVENRTLASTLRNEIQNALNGARKARDRLATVALSSVLADLRNREIQEGGEANDETVREVLGRAIKQRREAAEQMRAGGREDLAGKEDREVEVLARFLPPPLEEQEVRMIVREVIGTGLRDVGPVMGRLMPRIRGRFDGKEANRIVREELAR